MPITVFDPATPAIVDYPRPDRLLRGNPQRLTQSCHESVDRLVSAGIWRCESGAWNIRFGTGKEEFFCVLEGRVRVCDEAGMCCEVGPGQAAVIPAGFTGRFEVIEPVRKYYVVVDRSSSHA